MAIFPLQTAQSTAPTSNAKAWAVRHSSLAIWVLALGVPLCPAYAHAFEKQTYVGGGVGVSRYDRGKSLAPLGNVYLAYGLNDSFDVRLDAMSTWLKPIQGSEHRFLSSALLSCTYKLDVIQWIPWGGLGLGAHYLSGELAGPSRSSVEPGISALLGIDYAWSRSYGLSLAFGLHWFPLAEDRSPLSLRYTTSVLRFERRFGW